MSEKNLLILQSDRELKDYELERLHEKILEQKELGVILLPSYVKVLNIPDDKIDGELVVMNCGELKPEFVIRDSNGSYFKSFGKMLGSPLVWTDSEEKAAKYSSRRSAESMRVYLKTWYGCDFTRVEDI